MTGCSEQTSDYVLFYASQVSHWRPRKPKQRCSVVESMLREAGDAVRPSVCPAKKTKARAGHRALCSPPARSLEDSRHLIADSH